jgi:hypothetical protein
MTLEEMIRKARAWDEFLDHKRAPYGGLGDNELIELELWIFELERQLRGPRKPADCIYVPALLDKIRELKERGE